MALLVLSALTASFLLPQPLAGVTQPQLTRQIMTNPTRASRLVLSGFGNAKKRPPPKKQLSPKRQWDVYRELLEQGAEPTPVYARSPGGTWIGCGQVAVQSPGTSGQAAQMHKRLILEHAVRCNPSLTAVKAQLVCGVLGPDGEPVELEKQEVPTGLRAGYYGTPDAMSGYYMTYDAASEAFTGSTKKAGMGGF
ncbi:hypothetical protein AB1Y20_022681 [Prymnesium parvum]|uniref:Uncharacterized protein n=1 Tax=Prymnesium parvum TaxID=97485 RepID=A0AB34JIM2_PRYPA